ncbi:unnamed protein product [Durusdinium trenchii]|uniref:Uncharacterized protein n=1 Tax=Durusdinium trenchii TaxID=1381693 RepID=A0ABP0MQ26_9DINO
MPSFKSNLDGVPWYTKHPCGARKNPTKGVVPHNGTTTMLKPPSCRARLGRLGLDLYLSHGFPNEKPIATRSKDAIRGSWPYY